MDGSTASARERLRTTAIATIVALIASTFSVGCGASRYPPGMTSKEPDPQTHPLEGSPFYDGMTDEERHAFIVKVTETTVSLSVKRGTEDGTRHYGGTGVTIDDRGTVMTAYHVIMDEESVTASRRTVGDDGITVFRGAEVEMRVIATSAENDVALLQPIDSDHAEDLPPPIDIADGWVPVTGEQLWQFGRTSKWSRGIVTDAAGRVTRQGGDVELGFTVRPGDSGGPVVRTDGTLVGIVLARLDGDERTTLDDRGYFMPVSIGLASMRYPYRP